MKKLDYYKCDFCTVKNTKEKVEQHEKECSSDPAKKRCDSCEYFDMYMAHGLYHTEDCKKDVDGDLMSDIQIGEKNCIHWCAI